MDKLRTRLIIFLKIVLSLGVLLFCITPFLPDGKFDYLKNESLLTLSEIPFLMLPFVLLFSIMNFGLETIKWKMAASFTEKISYKTAIKGVLSGVTISSVFPWRSGEFIGKVAYLQAENQIKGSYLSIYSSMTQFGMTLIFGLLSFLFSKEIFIQNSEDISKWTENLGVISFSFLFGLLLFLFVFRNKVIQLLHKYAGPRLRYYLRGAKLIPLGLTIRLLGLSFLRYVSFVIPYVLLLKVAGTTADVFVLMQGISIVFLIQTLIPGFILSDLPIKGLIHIAVFLPFVSEASAIGNAVFVVFIFNQILPAVSGLVLLLFDKNGFLKR